MTVSLEIHGRNGNTGEPSGLFRSIEKVVLWGERCRQGEGIPRRDRNNEEL